MIKWRLSVKYNIMTKNRPIDNIPSRIVTYLMEWKQEHKTEYKKLFNKIRICELHMDQLHQLYLYISNADIKLMHK